MKSKLFRLIALFVVLAMFLTPFSAKPAMAVVGPTTDEPDTEGSPVAPVSKGEAEADEAAIYIVQLADPALASYRGGISGLEATSPRVTGAVKLDVNSAASQTYLSYLAGQQAQTLGAINTALGRDVEVVFQYQHAFNGFAIKLTPVEAAQVAKQAGVKNVWRETIEVIDTDAGPTWIGAPAIWEGNTGPGLATQGEGVIAGIIDGGINHDHPSFADVGDDGYNHTNPFGSGNYVGWCDTDDPTFCNDKLIGAWDFVYGLTNPPNFDFPSPEDENGHGSHTASTVAGNVLTATLIAPTLDYIKPISGVAPHANIIAYDVCYEDPAGNGLCPGSANLAAANQALADGVDVVNYSISGGNNPYNDPVELAFLALFEAGTFVSTSAGNSGPNPATLGHQSPWVSTTAAVTHNRAFPNFLVDMTGGDTPPPGDFTGLGFTSSYGPATVVYAGDYGDPLCPIGAFSPGTFDGEIVVCDRGTWARVDKAQSVADGGAGGFVLANSSAAQTLNGDAYAIPGVHITYADGVALKTWLATGADHTASITGIIEDQDPANGDITAGFSSRGPNTALDIVKPSTTAPGVDIWAAVNTPDPENPGPAEYNFLSGTSMSSPHNAGAGALMRALHPDWSAAEILSALMSTADTTVLKEDGVTQADYFDMGSGRIDLLNAGLAGLVFDETAANMEAADPVLGGDPRTLNLASMANSNCVGNCSWTRTVTSVLPFAATYTATFTSDSGVIGTVTPEVFTIPAGGTQELTITADVSALPQDEWAFGYVMLDTDAEWAGGGTADVVLSQDFNGATFPPAGWVVADNEGNGVEWENLAGCGEAGNYTGGSGDVACASSDVFGLAEFDTELWTPAFSLEGYTSAQVSYLANYANYAGYDYLDLDISTDGGATWTNLLSWNEDHGAFRATPGESVTVDLSAYAGLSNLILRWHYYDPNTDDYDWYAQVDDVAVSGFTAAGSVTDQHLVMTVVPAASTVPSLVTIDTNNKSGTQMLEDLQVAEEITDLTTLVDGMNKAAVSKPMVEEDPTNGDPYNGDGTYFTTIEVPAGALRLVAQVIESTSLDVDLFVGSGDTPSAATELYSSATGAVLEYISVDNPAADTYWVLVQNWEGSGAPTDLIALAVGAVVPGDASNLTVTGPATVPPGGLFDLAVNWSNPELVDDDVYYGVFSVGTDPANPGNLGSVDVNFRYLQQIFIMKTGPETAETDEVFQYSIVLEGDGPIQYAGMLTDTLPAGVEFSGNLTATYGTATYDEATNSVYWTNVMPPTAAQSVVTAPVPQVVTIGDLGFSANTRGTGESKTPTAPKRAPDALTITHSLSQEIIGGNSVSCNAANLHTDNSYLRVFDLPSFGINNDFDITNVEVGIESAAGVGGDQPTTMNLYTLDGTFIWANLTLIGTADFQVTDQALSIINVPVAATVPAGSILVAEFFTPDGQSEGNSLFVGSNDLGQTAPTYLAAADCGVVEPTDTASIGFPDMHLVMNVTGELQVPDEITISFDVTVTAGPTEEVTNVADLNYDGDPFSAETTFRVPGARLEVAHLAPFAADPGTAVTVTLNGAPALTNFEFADSTGYIPLPPGDYDVAVFPAGATDPAISGTVSLMDGNDYSAIATGDGVNQALGLLALADDNTAPAAGTFHLRIGHLAPFASGDALADVRLQDGTVILDDVAFGDVTGFTPLPAGEYDLKITSPDGATTYIDPLPVTFTDGQIISAYAVGDGVNQPLGVFAWPAGVPGFLLPLAEEPVEPMARLAVGHLAPFAMDPGTAVTVTLNGTSVLTGFEFADSTAYLDIPAGITHTVEIFAAGVVTPAISAEINLMEGMDYSAVAVGGANDWPLDLLALLDDNAAPAAGNFKLRLGHLAPFADTEAGTLADVRLQDGTVILDDVPFGAVAGYLELPAGTYDLKITSPDGMTTYIDPMPVTFADGDILTAFAVGDGANQPLGVFAWPSDAVGFLLPLAQYGTVYLPLVPQGYTVP